jgi:hypothetical protein
LLRIEGAPALFVDGERIGGALPQEQVWMVIDRACAPPEWSRRPHAFPACGDGQVAGRLPLPLLPLQAPGGGKWRSGL